MMSTIQYYSCVEVTKLTCSPEENGKLTLHPPTQPPWKTLAGFGQVVSPRPLRWLIMMDLW